MKYLQSLGWIILAAFIALMIVFEIVWRIK